ncbi:MAG TPA: choice-of-anchor B family protein [Flavobacteriales bacterium]|jgi:choice-of-anchor B domain-containing protein|nr:choice-of-anchor B family protein [Flavobacteriales bacterium]
MRTASSLLCSALALAVGAQTNITQLGHVDYHALHHSDLSNLWGYAAGGHEYALVGVNGQGGESGGLSIVDVTDPTDPQEVFFQQSANSIWREIKVWNDHAYVTTEAEAGLLIVDLSPLPESTTLPTTVFTGEGWITSHSLFIDENGRLYVNGANRGHGGCIFYDLTQDPMAPVEVGSYDTWYVHDCYARNNILYAAHILDGFFSIVDVSDPAVPVLLGTQQTPNAFTHNDWLDDSGQFLFTTDERGGSYVAAYDVSDPGNIHEVDRLQSDPGSNTIPHNTYWLNDYLVTSYYTYGVAIYDATHPDNLVEVGNFDTSPFSGDGFHGAWGVYPFLPSGNLLISDIEQGLFILGPTYQHACWLEGEVTVQGTGAPIFNATVTLMSGNVNDVTSSDGRYGVGTLTAGTYTVQVHAAGYEDATVTGVTLANGQVTVQDVQLVPLATTALTLHVTDGTDHTGIQAAKLRVRNADFTFDLTADAQGDITLSPFYVGEYTVTAGQWGWNTVCAQAITVTTAASDFEVPLPRGYADDFFFDNGWGVTSTSTTGHWVRGVPVGTTLGQSAVNPGADVPDDCGTQAFMTGNGGDQPGTDDVDLGLTTLTSPVFDASGGGDPYVLYRRWFFDSSTTNPANDTLTVMLDNGSTTAVVEQVTAQNSTMSEWVPKAIRVQDFLPATATMRLIVVAGDYPEENVVEGGLDDFRVVHDAPSGVAEVAIIPDVAIVPNPSTGGFMVRGPWTDATVEVLDVQGRRVMVPQRTTNGQLRIAEELPPAIYLVRVVTSDGHSFTGRAVVQ